jgi:hypothetical protein
MNDTEFQTRLRSMAAPDAARPLPSADVIWFRAELWRRLAAEDRAVRPLRIAEQLACAACLLAAVILVAVRF